LQYALHSPISAALDPSRIDCAALNGGFLLLAEEQLLLELKNLIAPCTCRLETDLHSYHRTPRQTQNVKAGTLRYSTTMQALQLATHTTVVQALKDSCSTLTATAAVQMQGKGANQGRFINMASSTQSWVTHNVASKWLLDDAAQKTAGMSCHMSYF
jgi:hypothetical protein